MPTAYNPNNQEGEAGGWLQVRGHASVHSEFQANQSYRDPSQMHPNPRQKGSGREEQRDIERQTLGLLPRLARTPWSQGPLSQHSQPLGPQARAFYVNL